MRHLLKGFLIAFLVVACSHFTVGEVDKTTVPTARTHIESWQKTFGGPKDSEANSVQQTTDGGYIIAGFTESYGAGSADAWLIKTDANGN